MTALPVAPTAGSRLRWTAGAAVLALAVDIASKSAAVTWLTGNPVELPGLTLRLGRNPGAAFSIGTNITPVFTLLAVMVIAGIGWHARKVTHRGWAIGLGLIAGGAAGNLVDRLFRAPGVGRGAVVDFLDFGWWPSFNLADSALVCGVALAILLSLRNTPMTTRPSMAGDPAEAATGQHG